MATEREWSAVIDSVKDYAIFMLDPGGTVQTWNTGARAIKQYDASEIIGRHISLFYTPEDRAAGRPQMLLHRAEIEGRALDQGWRVRRDGTRFWADVVITRVLDEHGLIAGFVKVTRDLTERKQFEEELRRAEESLTSTLYSIGDAVIVTDEEGRVRRLNRVAEQLTGWLQREADGIPIEEVFRIVNETTGETAANPVERVLEEGVIVGLANHTALISREGKVIPISDSGAPILDPTGKTHGAVLVFRDVTDERRAEEALRMSEERLRLMIASVRDYAIFMLDPNGYVATWNPGAEQIHGYTPQEIIGQHFSRFYPPEQADGGEPRLELDIAARDGKFEEEGWRIRKDGTRFWASVVLSAIRDDEGRLLGFTKVTRDMTERVQAEQELRKAELEGIAERERTERAERQVRERDVFLSVAAHELRTPLTALQLKLQSTELTIDQDAASGRARVKINDALRQTVRLGDLVERLLDVSRIAAGRFEIAREEEDLATIVKEVVRDLQDQARASGSEIHVSFDSDMSGCWDRRRIEQVVLNLLSNAVKYGDGRPVDVSLESDPTSVRLIVVDRGIGIDPDDLNRIFGLFERAAPVRNFGGLGLGLYITRYIVEAHGGKIEVASTKGAGTTFTVTLPRRSFC